MTEFLVHQLRFARREFKRCLDGVTEDEARQRLGQMNSISWMVAHMASHENYFWVSVTQGKSLYPELQDLVGYGKPASQPPFSEMWTAWEEITETADLYLDTLSEEMMGTTLQYQGKPLRENIGTSLMRNFYHYWFHIGEAHAVRQGLGHQDLPQFVGDFEEAEYPGKST